MRQISLREFRTRGTSALQSVPVGETILLCGRDGQAFFLVPVIGDIVAQDHELRRAQARASLRTTWKLAQESPNVVTDSEIDEEVKQVRSLRAGITIPLCKT